MHTLLGSAGVVVSGGERARIVEIGPFYGRSTPAMAQANPQARITSTKAVSIRMSKRPARMTRARREGT